jgi:predicted ATPase
MYPFDLSIFRETKRLVFERPVAFFVGENGSGKSTLLEAIARKCGVHVWHRPRRHLAHHNPFETRLADYITLEWVNGSVPGSLFRAETFGEFSDFLDDVALCDPGRLKYHGGQLLNVLSHGEAFFSYFSTRYNIKGIYFLDEPESALSPSSQVRFLHLLRRLGEKGHAQLIIATHSPILLACPGAQILGFDGPCVEDVAYEDTAHFKLYRQFFADRSPFLAGEDTGVQA